MSVLSNLWDNFKELFDFTRDVAEAMFNAIASLFKDEITDALADAAMAAVEAVEKTKENDSEADWSDYLKAAYEAVKDELEDDFESFSTTAVITAIQAAYASINKTDE